MKFLLIFYGAGIAIVGVVWCVFAFNMPTSVPYESYSSREIYNLDRAEQRRTHLMLSGFITVIGTVLFGFGMLKTESTGKGTKVCPVCAESIKSEALKCRYCGVDIVPSEPEIKTDSSIHPYDLKQMKRYGIEFSDGLYSFGDLTFDDLHKAVKHIEDLKKY
jgi:hypothetical protein